MNWPFLSWSCGLFTTSSQLQNSCHLTTRKPALLPQAGSCRRLVQGHSILVVSVLQAGADSTRGKFFAGGASVKANIGEALFHFQLWKSVCPSEDSPLLPFPPTHPSALLCSALFGAVIHGSPLVLHSLPLCLCLTSTFKPPSPVPSPGCLSFLNLQQGLQL